MSKPMNKKDITFIVIVLITMCALIFLLLTCVPIKVSVNEEIKGIEFNREDINDNSEATIKYNGYYYDYILELWNDDRYEGEITINGKEGFSSPVVYMGFMKFNFKSEKKTIYQASIEAYSEESNSLEAKGTFYKVKGKMTSGAIITMENSKVGYAFPASSKEDVQDLINRTNAIIR